MSEDKLEMALAAMRDENASPEQIAGAKQRVWERMQVPGLVACAEIRPGFVDYLAGRLPDGRRLLIEDHLSRCPQCRAQIAEQKGERRVVPMPLRRRTLHRRWLGWAAAAALVFVALYLGRDRIDTLLAPSGPCASVASINGSMYRLPEGVLQAGDALVQGEIVRTGPGAHAMLRLTDGSLVEVNERSELSVRAAWSGETIHLQRGDIIVQAAKQHRGHLRVQSRDSVAAVKGTVFAVSSGLGGTVVSVVEGSVEVTQPGIDVVLKPGGQAATKTGLASSVQDAVSWSADAEKYAALLASFASLEKEVAKLPAPALRTQPRLLQYLPANSCIYGAIPNISGTIRQTVSLVEQQSADNPALQEWWNSQAGQDIKRLIDSVQTVTGMLGDEIVFTCSMGIPGAKEGIPMLIAEVRPGKDAELSSALEALRGQVGDSPLPYSVTPSLFVASDSQEHLQWLFGHMGAGAVSPFAGAIAARYGRGAGWLLGMDIEPALLAMSSAPEAELTGMRQMRHFFLEQREVQGIEENEVTLTFSGPRQGLASWLAGSGSGGAAEYIPSDAAFAVYATTREPGQLFQELTAQISKLRPSSGGIFAELDAKLGAGFAGELATALGTESAFALEGFSTTGPVWVLTVLVNNPATIDSSIRKVVDVFNAELAPEEKVKRISVSAETTDGRSWTTLKPGLLPLEMTWTYDRGYMVAASDRATALRAISVRNGGAALVWSPAFQQQLPASGGLHPSAFAWLDTRGALEVFSGFVTSPTIKKVISERDPILVVFSGSTEQIHSASRTRLSGLVVDTMLLESLSRSGSAPQSPAVHQRSPGTR